MDLAQARLDKRTLVAPFDGRAGLRNVSPGDFVEAGTAIVNLEQIDPLKVDFRVPELFLPTVAPGQRIALAIDAFPARRSRAWSWRSIRWSTRLGAPSSCAPRSHNDEKKLRPGLFARVSLTLAERQNALFVPGAVDPAAGRQVLRVQGRRSGRRQAQGRQADAGEAGQAPRGRGRGSSRGWQRAT